MVHVHCPKMRKSPHFVQVLTICSVLHRVPKEVFKRKRRISFFANLILAYSSAFFTFKGTNLSHGSEFMMFQMNRVTLLKSAARLQLFSSIHKILSDISQQGAYSRELIGLHNINTFEVIILKSGHMFI